MCRMEAHEKEGDKLCKDHRRCWGRSPLISPIPAIQKGRYLVSFMATADIWEAVLPVLDNATDHGSYHQS